MPFSKISKTNNLLYIKHIQKYMVVSFEFAAQKIILITLSLIFLILGFYPYFSNNYQQIKIFDPIYTNYIIAAIALIQLIYVFRMKRPKIY